MAEEKNIETLISLVHAAVALRQAGYRWVSHNESERWFRAADTVLAECEKILGYKYDDSSDSQEHYSENIPLMVGEWAPLKGFYGW